MAKLLRRAKELVLGEGGSDRSEAIRGISHSAAGEASGVLSWLNFSRLIGIFCAIGSSFFLSVGFAIVKEVQERDKSVDSLELYAWRQTFLLLFTVPLVTAYQKEYHFQPSEWNKWLQLFGRTFFGSLNIYCMFKAVGHIQLQDATAVSSTAPIFCAIIARVVLKEKFGIIECICALVMFAGICLNVQPTWLMQPATMWESDDIKDHLIGTGFALLAAISGAISTVLMRTLRTIHFSTVQIIYSYLSVLTTWPIVFVTGANSWPACSHKTLMTLVGLSAVPMQSLYIYACQIEKAGIVSIARSSTPMWSFLWQLLFFEKIVDAYGIIGDILIVGCLIVLGLKKLRASQMEEEQAQIEALVKEFDADNADRRDGYETIDDERPRSAASLASSGDATQSHHQPNHNQQFAAQPLTRGGGYQDYSTIAQQQTTRFAGAGANDQQYSRYQ